MSTASSLFKKFGDIVTSGIPESSTISFLSTGITSYDMALGGGFPRGHISQVWGPDGGGKTLSCIPLIKSAQKNGDDVLYIAAEPKIDFRYFLQLGVDEKRIVFMRTNSANNIMDGNKVMDAVYDSAGNFGLIIVDSVAACVPKVAYSMDSGDTAIGLIAKMLSARLPLIAQKLSPTNTVLLLINQQRAYFANRYVDAKPFGGYAVRHYIAVNVNMRSSGYIPMKGVPKLGFSPAIKVEKNNFASPRRVATWDWYFYADDTHEAGPDTISDIVNAGKTTGCITAHGGYLKLNVDGELIALNHEGERGMEDAAKRLRAEPELFDLVYATTLRLGSMLSSEEEE